MLKLKIKKILPSCLTMLSVVTVYSVNSVIWFGETEIPESLKKMKKQSFGKQKDT